MIREILQALVGFKASGLRIPKHRTLKFQDPVKHCSRFCGRKRFLGRRNKGSKQETIDRYPLDGHQPPLDLPLTIFPYIHDIEIMQNNVTKICSAIKRR